MTENTAGNTITRPSFDEAYNELTGLDDAAISQHLGYDIEELFELVNDNAASNRQWLQTVEALEFVELRRKPNTTDELAAQLVREFTRKDLYERFAAYMKASFPELEAPDPESPEGKEQPPSSPRASRTRKSTATSAPEPAAGD